MRFKAVLYDMDGTVLDTLGDLTNAVNHVLELYGMPKRTPWEAAHALGYAAEHFVRTLAVPGTSEERIREILSVYRPWYDSHCDILTAPYPGVSEMMEKLQAAGVKQAVISNKQDSAVRRLAAQHFPGLLETAVGESATVRKKPNPDAVLAALAQMGVDRADAVYIGDTEVDLRTAENAGLPCVLVGWGFRTEEELKAAGAGRIFRTAGELCQWLLEESTRT